MPGLTIHKLADKTGPEPRPGESWPLAGVRIVDPPGECGMSTTVVEQGIAEGWITAEGSRIVNRPGGPPGDPDRPDTQHAFRHADALVLATVNGSLRYRVTHQPDKYADHAAATYPDQVKAFDADDSTKVTKAIYDAGATRVDHFYLLELED